MKIFKKYIFALLAFVLTMPSVFCCILHHELEEADCGCETVQVENISEHSHDGHIHNYDFSHFKLLEKNDNSYIQAKDLDFVFVDYFRELCILFSSREFEESPCSFPPIYEGDNNVCLKRIHSIVVLII